MESLQKSTNKFIQLTFKSRSKFIRILSLSSSVIICWTVSRWFYINLRSKIFNYPPCYYLGVPILGSMIYALNTNDFAELDYNLGECGPIILTPMGTNNYILLNDINLIRHKSRIYQNLIYRNTINLWPDRVNQFSVSDVHWHRRRRIASNAFLKPLNSKYLNKRYIDILNTEIFPKLDKLAQNNKLYNTINKDMSYLIFAIIYSTSFGNVINIPSQNDMITYKFFNAMKGCSKELVYGLFISMIFGVRIANIINFKLLNIFVSWSRLNHVIIGWITEYETIMRSNNCNNNNNTHNYYIHDMLNQVKNGKLSRKEMIRDCLSMFLGGVATTTITLESALFYLVKYQNIQQRIYNELNLYKEKHGIFSLQYINELNILRSFIFEVLRNIRHDPHSFPRFVDNNVKIGGYNIPKGFYIIGNYFYVNHCYKYWKKPNKFYIQHFLDDNNKFKMNKNMISFGVGKRDCSGQSLAIKNLHYILGRLILRYKMIPNNNDRRFDELDYIPTERNKVKSIPFTLQMRD